MVPSATLRFSTLSQAGLAGQSIPSLSFETPDLNSQRRLIERTAKDNYFPLTGRDSPTRLRLGGGLAMLLQKKTSKTRQKSSEPVGSVVFQTICQNPGCGNTFELRIMPRNTGVLASAVSCSHCRRPAGSLKTCGRLAPGVFAAKLVFRRQRPADRSENVSSED
jgi:hypothetical protein